MIDVFCRLIEFLLGETDGTPREPRHLFRLYMAKRQFTEAAKTAVRFYKFFIYISFSWYCNVVTIFVGLNAELNFRRI